MKTKRLAVFALLIAVCACAQPDSRTHPHRALKTSAAMTVDDVVRLAKAGLSDEVILAQIRAKRQTFDLSANQLVALKSAGASDSLIRAILQMNVAQPPAFVPNTAPTMPAASAWISHTDPAGFSVRYPPGWRLSADRQAGRIVVSGPGRQQVIFWPTFLHNQQLDARGAAVLAQQLAHRADPGAPWGTPESSGNAVRLIARGPTKGIALLRWNTAPDGASVFLACVTAPASLYPSSKDAFAGILDSFRFVADPKPAVSASPKAAAAEPVAWVRWSDPREGAFSASVPRGWSVSGGSVRYSATDIRKSLILLSPDRQIRLAIGDPNIGIFTAPNGVYSRFGMRSTSLGDGTQLQIRPFSTAQQFLQQYLGGAVARECSGLRVLSENDRSDLASSAAEHARAQGAANPRISAAGVSFACTWNGAEARGYYAVATSLPLPGRSGIWYVDELYGYLAAAGQMQQADDISRRVLNSMGINAQWKQREDQIAGNAVAADNQRSAEIQARARQAIADDQQKTSDMIVKGYQDRSKVYDEISRRRENAILGTVDVIDPATGEQYKIDNYSDYHWMNNQGVIAGTRTDTSPGLGWRQMIDLP